jgi:hypothetical protein
MNPDDTLPPVPAAPAPGADDGELWPSSGPAKGFRVRLPIAIASLVVVALAGAAAGASLKHSPSTTTQAGAISNRARGSFGGANGANGATGANGAGRAFGPGGGVFGTVTKVDGNTVTVTQRDGSTATVVVPSSATISKTDSGTLADLKPGTSIVVRGTTANGTTTAQDVTIAPANGAGAFGGFGGFGGGRTRTGTTPTTTN